MVAAEHVVVAQSRTLEVAVYGYVGCPLQTAWNKARYSRASVCKVHVIGRYKLHNTRKVGSLHIALAREGRARHIAYLEHRA